MKTKTEIELIPFVDIIIDERARRKYEKIEDLADSIKKQGLINPLTVMRQENGEEPYTLLCGGRRYKALQQLRNEDPLAWQLVPCTVYDYTSDTRERKLVELVENIQREQLTWQEQHRLVKAIHETETDIHGEAVGHGKTNDVGWSKQKTAELVGFTPVHTARMLELAECLEIMPELEKCCTAADAQRVAEHIAKRVYAEISVEPQPVDEIRAKLCESYILRDALEGLAEVPPASIDYIDLDWPYNVELRRRYRIPVEMAQQVTGSYNAFDSDASYLSWCTTVLMLCAKTLKDTCWMVIWHDYKYQHDIIAVLSELNLAPRSVPAIWVKNNAIPPQRFLANHYEPILYVGRDPARPVNPNRIGGNVFTFPIVSQSLRTHPTEKPIELLQEVMSALVLPNSKVLVPFLGSGNALLAAANIRCSGFGFDIEPEFRAEFVRRANEREPGQYTSYVRGS